MEDLIFKTIKKALPEGDAFLFVNFIKISYDFLIKLVNLLGFLCLKKDLFQFNIHIKNG